MVQKRNSGKKSSGIQFVKQYDDFSDSNKWILEEQLKYEITRSMREQYLCDVFLGAGFGLSLSDIITAYETSSSLRTTFSETSGYFALGAVLALVGAYFRNYFKAHREDCELKYDALVKKK